jgi:hypothetical protein
MSQFQARPHQPELSTDRRRWPRISVVTPSYNQACFLEICIASVLSQEYPELEYIVIDGGSTDESVEIIKKYQERIAYWVSEPDNGQSDAINKGFRQATGAVVAWLNSDDFYLPGALTAVAEAYRSAPLASFYFGNGWRVDETGKPKCSYYPDETVRFNRDALIFGINYIMQPATFINRAHLVAANYLDPHLHFGMDTDLWIRLSQLAPPIRISSWLAATREYGTTKTSTGAFQRVEELRQIAEKHSGLPMTPGTLCYFLDTLHQFIEEHEDVFPNSYKILIETLWEPTTQLMAQYGARPDSGFPFYPDVLFKQISELNERLQIVEADRAARLNVIEQLSAQLAAAEADRANHLALIQEQDTTIAQLQASRPFIWSKFLLGAGQRLRQMWKKAWNI